MNVIEDIAPKLFVSDIKKAEIELITYPSGAQETYFSSRGILFKRAHIQGSITSISSEDCIIKDSTDDISIKYKPSSPGITITENTPINTPVVVVGAIQKSRKSGHYIIADKIIILPSEWNHWPLQIEELSHHIYPKIAIEQDQALKAAGID